MILEADSKHITLIAELIYQTNNTMHPGSTPTIDIATFKGIMNFFIVKPGIILHNIPLNNTINVVQVEKEQHKRIV